MPKIPLLIDTDPGVDDALAILMALRHPEHEVLGLTVAAGNVGLDHTVRNALCLLETAGHPVPVFAGCATPLLHPAEDAAFVHGQDGFGDVGLPAPNLVAEPEHAAIAILRLSRAYAGRLVLVMLGPLTNLALALRLDPQLPQRVARLVVMGGAVNLRGNTSVAAEFNIAFDPEAAHIVFEAWPRFDLVDWEATLAHPIGFADMDRWMAAGGEIGGFYERISRKTRDWVRAQSYGDRWHAADGLAMAAVLEPEGIEVASSHAVEIEITGRLARGATVVDWQDRSGQPAKVRILERYAIERFHRLVRLALSAPQDP